MAAQGKIREIEASDENLKGRHINGIADPAIFAQSGAESVAQSMERLCVSWLPAKNDRLNGKMQLHNRLAFDDNGIPMLYVFNTCKHFIRTMPNLVYSETDVEDVDTDCEDHIYDECRYICMENPIAMRIKSAPEHKPFDPLSDDDPAANNRQYAWYKIH